MNVHSLKPVVTWEELTQGVIEVHKGVVNSWWCKKRNKFVMSSYYNGFVDPQSLAHELGHYATVFQQTSLLKRNFGLPPMDSDDPDHKTEIVEVRAWLASVVLGRSVDWRGVYPGSRRLNRNGGFDLEPLPPARYMSEYVQQYMVSSVENIPYAFEPDFLFRLIYSNNDFLRSHMSVK